MKIPGSVHALHWVYKANHSQICMMKLAQEWPKLGLEVDIVLIQKQR